MTVNSVSFFGVIMFIHHGFVVDMHMYISNIV